MIKRRLSVLVTLAAAVVAAAFATPVAGANLDTGSAASQVEAVGITAEEFEQMAAGGKFQPPPGGWDTPSNRSYYLLSSCQHAAGVIDQGARAWNGLTKGGGTPVECRNSYITDCGGGGRIVGCNWGRGQRIALYLGGVSDDALLAAHEFGHDWYGHSSYRCAGWSSPAHVMAPSMCGGAFMAGDQGHSH